MITESNIYWMTRLDEIKTLLSVAGGVMCVIFGVALMICLGGCIVNKIEDDKEYLRSFKKALMYVLPIFLFGLALPIGNVFIPTTKQYAMIKVIPAIANDQRIQQEATEIYDMAKQALKQTLQIPNLEKPKAEKQEIQGSKP
jgi:hypothetical protein